MDPAMKWVPAVEPITFDRPGIAGVSGGRSFARRLLALPPGSPVGIIPAAVGGTPISAWMPGGKDPESEKHPYDDALKMAAAARRDGEIVAILWHQGETDAAERNDRYAEDFTRVVENVRRDLALPEIPFICGELGRFLCGEWHYPPVEAAIRQVAESLPRMGCASSEGLTDKGDKLHFDTASQHRFGERFFAEYLRLTSGK